ncbi:SH3 domain-containing protein [Chloroflexi bacterium TSY]|nr:SH3 domain-containing protein [Chloroflexi bacterium TSY]
MNKRNAVIVLRDVLSSLYPDNVSIRRVAQDAGLKLERIRLTGMAINDWDALLVEAERHNKIEAVLHVASNEYSDNDELRNAVTEYRAVRSNPQEFSFEPNNRKPEKRRFRQTFIVVILILIGIALLYFMNAPEILNSVVPAPTPIPTPYPSDTPVPTLKMIPPSPTPVPTHTSTLVPKLFITSFPANVRQGPGTDYMVLGVRGDGESFDIIGKNSLENWWQIRYTTAQKGWIRGDLVRTENADSVPVTTPPPLPPSPVPTRIPVDTPTPVSTHTPTLPSTPTNIPPRFVIPAVWEEFEHGYMLWRSDVNKHYAFYREQDTYKWSIFPKWDEGTPVLSRGEPPEGLLAPIRGFGHYWGKEDEVFKNLGWATDREKSFCATIQILDQARSEQEFILESAKQKTL